MSILIIAAVLVVLLWGFIYTLSYGIWTFKENQKGGIALFILALISVVIPLYLLWQRK